MKIWRKKENHEIKSSDFGCKTLDREAFSNTEFIKIGLQVPLNKTVKKKIGKGSEKVGIICVKKVVTVGIFQVQNHYND